jgi:hypothetical protein
VEPAAALPEGAAVSKYHTSLAGLEVPPRIRALPVDERGFPVPRFVAEVDGKPDHRVVDSRWFKPAIEQKLCWICGQPMGRYFTSLIGCMCAVNRVISEPPSHHECATFAARACPFLARPHAHRRERGMPEERREAAGFGLQRNPGVVCLWVSKTYPKPFRAWAGQEGVLFQLGPPVETIWYREGRRATREEVETAIEDGLPALREAAEAESPAAVVALDRMVQAARVSVLP